MTEIEALATTIGEFLQTGGLCPREEAVDYNYEIREMLKERELTIEQIQQDFDDWLVEYAEGLADLYNLFGRTKDEKEES